MYHPPRGGVRGGRDQFNWEDVKADKHRENYLGHSLHAPVGRWQQGKDLTWYAKGDKKDDSHKKEINALKEAESDVMAELLGGGKRRVVTGNVTQQELTNVLKKQQEDEESDNLKEEVKGFKSSGRLSISEMVPDDTRLLIQEGTLLQEDKGISITNWDDKNISEKVASTFRAEDKKKEKKIKKEKKKKKHKKDKHRSSKEKHSKRSKRNLSVSSSQDDDAKSNESTRGRSRYRKIGGDHKGNRDHSRPRSSSPKRDTGRYRSLSSSKRRGILRNRSRSTSAKRNITRYRSRSDSPKRDAKRYNPRSKSPRRNVMRHLSRSNSPRREAGRDSRYRSPRREAIRHRSRSKSPKREAIRRLRSPNRSRSRDRYSSQRYRNDDDKHRFSYSTGNDRRDRARRSRNY